MDDILTLIAPGTDRDALGVPTGAAQERDVFCQVNDVTRAEFYQAGRSGLNPEFQFTVFAGDYAGETVCRFHGQQFGIYRTYHVPGTDYMELYAERKGGTNGSRQ